MTTTQRKALPGAVNKLDAIQTGTGLYDTILAAYKSVTASYRPGVPNQVLVFTDGRNEDDPGSITATQLAGQLQAKPSTAWSSAPPPLTKRGPFSSTSQPVASSAADLSSAILSC